MIKLIVNPRTQPCIHFFKKSTVVIGSGADLDLPQESLLPVHIKISKQNGQFVISNQANDPFVTLNDYPFGKKLLKNNDIILIGNTFILFSEEAEEVIDEPAANFNSEEELNKLELTEKNSTEPEIDLSSLIKQVEALEDLPPIEQKASPPLPLNSPIISRAATIHQRESLKDYYLSEFDDENLNKNHDEMSRPPQALLRWNWKLIGLAASAFIAIIFIIFSVAYVNMSEKNNEDELKAAAGVADVAMALTYAQMNQGKPQNLNWSDPEFIKNNLLAALAPKYNPIDTLDSHGQFLNNSYFIRIYTSSNLSHFLVIAQPAPSILHWLIPRASIVVDSKYMELRQIDDLKALNRVLLNPNTLDGTNQTEVSQIINQGELIPLSTLASKTGKHGFTPPKFLGSIRPGAENLIYNAPRYYPFGESFLKKALMLSENHGNSQEVTLLQNQLKALEKYPNLILYSALGMQRAVQAQKALNTFLPHNKLLVSYLKLNSKGLIISSNLLMDDAIGEMAIVPLAEETSTSALEPPLINPEDVKIPEKSDIDSNHPLLLKLTALQTDRQNVQRCFESELTAFLKEDTDNRQDILEFLMRMELLLKKSLPSYQEDPLRIAKTASVIQFLDRFRTIIQKYDEKFRHDEGELIQSLSKLYEDYADMPLANFMKYIKAAGLDEFVQQHLMLQKENSSSPELPLQLIEELMQKIKFATNLTELHEHVEELARILNLEKYPDPEPLIAYQSEVRVQVLDKLNDFMLSSEKGLPKSDFTEENRQLVSQIMKTAWVTDTDEFDFYINEFTARQG